jgi:hypothetical protein
MVASVESAVINSLCPELRAIVEAELARGNVITETSATWGLGGGTVWLMRQFAAHNPGGGVVYRRLVDPHDGFGEFVCQSHRQILVCGLGT